MIQLTCHQFIIRLFLSSVFLNAIAGLMMAMSYPVIKMWALLPILLAGVLAVLAAVAWMLKLFGVIHPQAVLTINFRSKQ